MVWYPSVDDIIDINITVLELTHDKHPHKLLRSRQSIQSIIDRLKAEEEKGLIYQAALLMKHLVASHPFAGANHRTAYGVAKWFLRRNGRSFEIGRLEDAYAFIKTIERRSLQEIERWIEHGAT